MRWRVALLSAFGVAWAFILGTPGMASAHATLVTSSPADDSRLTTAPHEVTLTFDESVSLGADAARVIAADGARADTGAARLAPDGRTVVIPLRPNLPTGSYAATWRVVSADTHVVTGSVVFGVGVDPGAPPSTAPPQPASVTAADRIVHGVLYLGLVAGAGTAVVVLALWPSAWRLRRIRWVIGCGWAAIFLATLATFVVRAAAAADVGVTQAFSAGVRSSLPHVEHAGTLLARLILTAGLGLTLLIASRLAASRRPRALVPVALIAAGIALTVALDGHARVGDDAWLAVTSTTVHVAAMMIWLGGLLALALLLVRRTRPDGGHDDSLTFDSLRRWSGLAFVTIAALVLSGEYQAWRQIRPVQSLWTTGYGITLLVKLALVVAMLGLAVIGRRRLRPDRLRRSVGIETVCGIAVVIVTAVLVTEPPARTTFGPTVTVTAPLEGRSAQVTITPTRRGPTTITVDIVGSDGKPVVAQQVHGTLSSTAAGVPALAVKFAPVSGASAATSPGAGATWRSSATSVPLAGSWTLTLTVQFDAADALVTAVDYPVW